MENKPATNPAVPITLGNFINMTSRSEARETLPKVLLKIEGAEVEVNVADYARLLPEDTLVYFVEEGEKTFIMFDRSAKTNPELKEELLKGFS